MLLLFFCSRIHLGENSADRLGRALFVRTGKLTYLRPLFLVSILSKRPAYH